MNRTIQRRCHGKGYLFLYPTIVNTKRPSELVPYLARNRGITMGDNNIQFIQCNNLHKLPPNCRGVLCSFSFDKKYSWDLGIVIHAHPSVVMIVKIFPQKIKVSIEYELL
jgi:hypothetical protein